MTQGIFPFVLLCGLGLTSQTMSVQAQVSQASPIATTLQAQSPAIKTGTGRGLFRFEGSADKAKRTRLTGLFAPAAPRPQDDTPPAVEAGMDELRTRFTTLYGPVGLLTVPTAYVAAPETLLFGMTSGRNFKTAAFDYGIARSFNVGAVFADQEGANMKVLGNAKVNIVPQNFRNFELGIGVIDFADAINASVYIMASLDYATQTILERSIGLRLHAGFGTGLFRDKLIAGTELVLNRRFSIAGEYNGININAALRYAHDANFGFQLGFQNTDIFVNASYRLRF